MFHYFLSLKRTRSLHLTILGIRNESRTHEKRRNRQNGSLRNQISRAVPRSNCNLGLFMTYTQLNENNIMIRSHFMILKWAESNVI